YRALIEQAADGIYIVDAQDNFLMVNAQTCAMAGCTEEELLRMNIRDFLLEEDLVHAPLRLEEIRTSKAIIQMERRARRKDGAILYVESRAKALDDERLQIIIHDVTARKQVEEALRESEEHFRQAFDEAAIGKAWVALDGRFLRVNRSLCEIVG